MDIPLWLTLTLGCTLACAATLGGCHWWFARKLTELNHKLAKLDKARQFSGQQAAQARKQIEQLQTELATQQRNLSRAHAARQRTEHLDLVLGGADTAAAGAAGSTLPVIGLSARPPAHGFADTQPMESAGI